MQKKFTLFLLLLLFTRCNDGDRAPLLFIPHTGGSSRSKGEHTSPDRQFSARVPSPPSVTKDKVIQTRKKRDRHPAIPAGREINPPTGRNHDSLFIARLSYLRSNHIEPDLNEPVSRDFLFAGNEFQPEPALITLSNESFMVVNFDNDIIDYTDRFYTNGIKIDLVTPGLHLNPIGKLMVPYWQAARNYYGLSLVQNMYTPSTTKIGGILYGDRPYAAYLYLGSFKITLDPIHNYKQTSELDIGIIGPKSYGEWVQRSFHNAVPTNNEPLGWEYQVRNDIVLNYSLKLEKGIWDRKNIDLILSAAGEAGTLYTNMSGGFQFRTGWMNPYFANIGLAKKAVLEKNGLRKFQFAFFVKGTGKLVGYDATLQGGMLNRSSSYVLPAGEISRLVFQGSSGISLGFNGFRLDMEQFLLSPDFHNGWWHKWVHLSLAFCL